MKNNKIHAVSQDGKWEDDVSSFGQAVQECDNAIVHCFDSVHMIYLCSFENGHRFENEEWARHALSLR